MLRALCLGLYPIFYWIICSLMFSFLSSLCILEISLYSFAKNEVAMAAWVEARALFLWLLWSVPVSQCCGPLFLWLCDVIWSWVLLALDFLFRVALVIWIFLLLNEF